MKRALAFVLLLTATVILAVVTALDGYWLLTIACIVMIIRGILYELDRP